MYRTGHLSVAAVLLLLIFPLTIIAQQEPSITNFPLKEISWQNSDWRGRVAGWSITGKKTSYLVAVNSGRAKEEYSLRQLELGGSGKVKVIGKSFFISNSYPGRCSTVYLEKSKGAFSSARSTGGIVLSFIPVNKKDPDLTLELIMVGLSPSDGKQVIKKQVVFRQQFPGFANGSINTVKACIGPSSIGVLISMSMYAGTYPHSARMYFLEFDFEGKPLGKAKEVKLPGGGKNHYSEPTQLVHNGAGWIAPVIDSRFVRADPVTGYFSSKENALYIFTARGKTFRSTKTKLLKLFSYPEDVFSDYGQAFFLPTQSNKKGKGRNANGPKRSVLDLFFSERRFMEWSKTNLLWNTYRIGVVAIDQNGKKAGSVVKIDLPQWNFSITWVPGDYPYIHEERFSNPEPAGKDSFFVSQIRQLYIRNTAGAVEQFKGEQEISLYRINSKTGSVTLLSRSKSSRGSQVHAPLLRMMKDKVLVLNSANTMIASYVSDTRYYYTSIKP